MKYLFKTNYLTLIQNSINSNTFRNLYFEVDGVQKDVLEDGNLSCAFFVSNILLMVSNNQKLITAPHATVSGTIKDMKANGWYEIDKMQLGAVLHWESGFGKSGTHEHIGFYMGDNFAISNSSTLGYPVKHSFDFDGTRKVEKIFWHDSLN